jgi:cyclophilin family peptidyl-prolyl cis-trans isomerase
MAKRRRRHDDKKIHKRDKHAKRRQKYEEKIEKKERATSKEKSSTIERKPSRYRESKRRDISVLGVAIICIVAVIGGYLFYNYYDDIFNPESANQDNTDTIPTPQPNGNNNNGNDEEYEVPDFSPLYPSNPIVVMEIKEYGVIVIELYEHVGEIYDTIQNFLQYVQMNFYDNLIFHRVIDDFMIQTGGFDKDMHQKQPPFPPIPLQVTDELRHVDGAVAMARTDIPNSATSQFYICDGPQSGLDGSYAVFGQVVGGMDIVRKISRVDFHDEAGHKNVPVDDIIINRIYLYTGPII